MKIQTINASAIQFSSGPSVTLTMKVRRVQKKAPKRRPTLAELNAEIDANPMAYRRTLQANSLRLTGKPNL